MTFLVTSATPSIPLRHLSSDSEKLLSYAVHEDSVKINKIEHEQFYVNKYDTYNDKQYDAYVQTDLE